MRREIILVVAIAALFALSACSGTQADEPQVDSSAATSSEAVGESSNQIEEIGADPDMDAGGDEHPASMDEESSGQTSSDTSPMQPASDRPAWQNLALTNVSTGESFTLGDFEGKTVFVEPMATWCSNCRRQLNNVRDASFQLDREDVVLVALSVETTIDDTTLAEYASSQGFDWLFAVASPELLGELVDEFGRAITNPPATPHFIIRPDGSTTDLVTGIEPAADLLQQIAAAQG